jgi:hypothetical protein
MAGIQCDASDLELGQESRVLAEGSTLIKAPSDEVIDQDVGGEHEFGYPEKRIQH